MLDANTKKDAVMAGHDGGGGSLTRRRVLILGGAAAAGVALAPLAPRPAAATAAMMHAEIRKVVGEAPVHKGKVKLDLPPLVENGNTVPMSIEVESPMTAADHVKAIHVFNEKNPQPHVIGVKLSPRSGRAALASRVRLADSQTIVAIAEMSDGSFWSDEVDVVVTLAACVEPDR
jgi:sulfur-oxidizing protein SoxY